MGDTLLFFVGDPPVIPPPAVPPAEADSLIEHTSYLFPDYDGAVGGKEERFIQAYDTTSFVTIPSLSKTSDGANWVSGSTDTAVIPAAASGVANATGNYRTRIQTTAAANSHNGIAPDVAIGYVRIYATDDAFMGTNTQYWYDSVVSGGAYHDNMIMWGREVAPNNFSEFDSATRYYEGDWEDEEIYYYVSAYADVGTGIDAFAQIASCTIWNEAEYNSGGDDWEGCRDAATGYQARNSDSSLSYNMTAAFEQFDNNYFSIWRSFYSFDFGEFSTLTSGTRDLISSTLSIAGTGSSDSSVIAQIGTQADTLTTADFDAFTGGAVSDVVDWEHIGNVFNTLTFNTTGSGYINTQMANNVQAKFCLREYEHDYSDIAPSTSGLDTEEYENGGIYVDNGSELMPRFLINYTKLSEFIDAGVEAYWSVLTGSWDENAWISDGTSLELQADGVWEDDERWSGIRLTFTGPANLDFTAVSNGGDLLVDAETITSNQVLTLHWKRKYDQWNGDFDKIQLSSSGDSFRLQRIDFLER